MELIGDRIRYKREKKEISQYKLAGCLNIANNTLSQYEKNKRIPDVYTLKKIADELDTSLDYLVTGENNVYSDELEVLKIYRALKKKGEKKKILQFINQFKEK